jgi:hypothetical protein
MTKRGRPDLGLSTVINFKVTPAMYEALRQVATSEGKTVSQWLREVIGERVNPKPWAEYETRDNAAIQELLHRWHNRGERS